VDVNAEPDSRLVNLIMQRRARWLKSRREDLFLVMPEPAAPETRTSPAPSASNPP
jgi:hypothetical protein